LHGAAISRRSQHRQRHAPHVITTTTIAWFSYAVNFPLTGSAQHKSRSEGTLRRFLSPITHRYHDATVRQHQAHDPHQSLGAHRQRISTDAPAGGEHHGGAGDPIAGGITSSLQRADDVSTPSTLAPTAPASPARQSETTGIACRRYHGGPWSIWIKRNGSLPSLCVKRIAG